jgi:hypothetical protein
MKGEHHKILSSSSKSVLHTSRRHALFAVALIRLITQVDDVCGFINPVSYGPRTVSLKWTTSTTSLRDAPEEGTRDEDLLAGPPSAIWNWNAANSSLGSLLLRLQKEEEEEMRRAVGHTNTTSSSWEPTKRGKKESPAPQNELSPLDLETAREIDDAVIKGSKEDLLKGIQILPSSSLYATLTKKKGITKLSSASRTRPFRSVKKQEEFEPEALNMPLSMPEHYNERIGRDMRHLAVSIASNVDEVWQWRLFCREKGGIIPLLKCVQDGARSIHARINEVYDSQFDQFAADQDEETLMAGCTACRTFRDLCALSPEVSAIVTDGILRAEDGWGASGPMADFVTLLNHANEVELKREARDILRLNRRNRRRKCIADYFKINCNEYHNSQPVPSTSIYRGASSVQTLCLAVASGHGCC